VTSGATLDSGWRSLVCLPSEARGAAGFRPAVKHGSPEGAGTHCQGRHGEQRSVGGVLYTLLDYGD
jgi:hypothetical protein